jgi:mono/diheme cytochrome c family protein
LISRPLILTLLALLPLAVGCGDYQAEFVHDERVEELQKSSPVAAVNVRGILAEHFGSPNTLVAWGALPIDFGEISGTVLSSTDINTLRIALDSDPPGRLGRVAVVLGTKTPHNRLAADYDAANRTLRLVPQDGAAAVAPGTTIRLIGHNLQAGRRLFMQHCMHCHGVTGDGNGPTARYIANHRLNPRPRDYRRGLFKFTSTKNGFYASRDDLRRTITQGLAGTYMPSFLLMETEELDAIVEYVRFLAMRGEVERRLLDHLKDLMPTADGKPPADLKSLEKELAVDGFAEAFADAASLVAENWSNAELPENSVNPSQARLPDTATSRLKGRNLFISTKINCAKCHGEGGRGNGAFLGDFQKNPETQQNYETPGLRDAWHNMIRPRNLTSGVYRGGRRPLDVFRRVTAGIKATPMAGFATLPEEDRWHLVNYVLSIPIDGAFFDEHGHQYHGGTNPHAGHDHSDGHSHETPHATDDSQPKDSSPADSRTTKPVPTKSAQDKKTQP